MTPRLQALIVDETSCQSLFGEYLAVRVIIFKGSRCGEFEEDWILAHPKIVSFESDREERCVPN